MTDPSWFDLIVSWFNVFMSFVLHIDKHLFELVAQVGNWLYGILFTIVFCETGLVVTPFLPGDSLLFASGAVAGAGHLNYWFLVATLLAAAIVGDTVNFKIGHWIGPTIFSRETRFLNKKHLLQAHAFYERHGGKAIILARFVPVVRTFAPFVAGVALMNPLQFILYNATGAVIWVFSLTTAGYFLGNLPFVRDHFSLIVYGIIVVSVMPVVIEVLRSMLRRNKNTPNTEERHATENRDQ